MHAVCYANVLAAGRRMSTNPIRSGKGQKLLRLAAVLALAAGLTACVEPQCTNEVLVQRASPDGRFVATLFERGCGATTGQVRIVALHEHAGTFDPERRADWIFAADTPDPVGVSWKGGDSLVIDYEALREPPVRKEQWNGVSVGFQRHQPSAGR